MTIQRTAYLVAHLYTDPTGRMHPEHAAKVLAHGTYMDADRYDMLRDALEEAKIGAAVLWDAKSEAA